MIFSCPIFSKISDRFGRKITLLLLPIPQILALVMTIVSNDLWILYLSRVFVGIGDGCLYSTLPVYIGEISVPSIRGVCGNLVSVFILLGVFLINVIGTYLDVMMTAYICMIVPVVYFILMLFMPESPYYHLTKNDEISAKTSLRRLRGIQNVDEIFSKLKLDLDNNLSQAGTWTELVTIKSNRRALIAGVFLRISHQLGGAATFNVYTKLIFEKSGAELGSEIPSMISSGLGVFFILISGYFIEKLGRKTSYLFSLSSCGLVLILMAIYFYLDQCVSSLDLSEVKWLPIAGMILFYVFNSFGLFNIPTLMSGEIFSTSIKAKAMSIVTLTFGLFMFLANTIFHILEAQVGLFAAMLFFGVANIVSVVLTVFLIPETKGKTLEEIQQILGG
ncbi:unnamed protein product [Phaedon cochleariae]|uniref:Major facilitator superfamily (MFS) profile domain-containing protein n=1 Tax=Phaedon cochleariae TaxID=80249 RepID=A0A9P0DNE9_PHACE|nr:unnamed protein product [Phaedon cochleariae]